MAKRKTKPKTKTRKKPSAGKTKASSRFKGVSYWSFPGGMENRADIVAALGGAREIGFAALELGISDTGVLTLDTSRSECRALARAAEAAEVKLSSLATNLYWTTNLASPRAGERAKAVEMTKVLIEKTAWLRAGTLVVVPGWVHSHFTPRAEPVPYDEALARARESLKKCVKAAEKARVTLALLNAWSGLLLSPLEFAGFIERLRSKRVGACLDLGTAALSGYPQHWIKLLGRRISLVRVTDLRGHFESNAARNRAFRDFGNCQGWGFMAAYCEPGTGNVDWPAVVAALRKTRYRGPLVALSHPPRSGVLERTAAFMDNLVGSA